MIEINDEIPIAIGNRIPLTGLPGFLFSIAFKVHQVN